jgi:hypothetical protein
MPAKNLAFGNVNNDPMKGDGLGAVDVPALHLLASRRLLKVGGRATTGKGNHENCRRNQRDKFFHIVICLPNTSDAGKSDVLAINCQFVNPGVGICPDLFEIRRLIGTHGKKSCAGFRRLPQGFAAGVEHMPIGVLPDDLRHDLFG